MSRLITLLLVLSLVANVILGIWWAEGGGEREDSARSSAGKRTRQAPAAGRRGDVVIESWAQVSSPADREGFARDLQRMGFPERLIQNALVAAIDRDFMARRASRATLEEKDFWTSRDAREQLILERSVELYELANERRLAIGAATGTSGIVAPSKRWRGAKSAAGHGLTTGFLAPDAADSVAALLGATDILRKDLDSVSAALSEERLTEFREGVYEEFEADLNEVLNAEERERMELMMFEMDFLDVRRSEKKFLIELKGDDRRDMLRILKPKDFLAGVVGLPTNSAERTEMEAAIRNRFGAEVAEEFKKFKW